MNGQSARPACGRTMLNRECDRRRGQGSPTRACVLALSMVLVPGTAGAGTDPPEFVLEWGSLGAGEGQFSGPHGIEVDAEGNVYVADTGNNRVQKFTSEGLFLRESIRMMSGR